MNRYNPAGYNLIEGKDNIWYLQVIGQVAFTGSMREVVKYAVLKLGFHFRDLHEAILFMGSANANAAHFGGINKRFIYSFNQDLTPIRKAN